MGDHRSRPTGSSQNCTLHFQGYILHLGAHPKNIKMFLNFLREGAYHVPKSDGQIDVSGSKNRVPFGEMILPL